VKVYAFLSQIIPYGDPELEMLYSYGRFLLPHLPSDREAITVKLVGARQKTKKRRQRSQIRWTV